MNASDEFIATRWMSRYECVRRILNQWNVLQKFFHQAAIEEKCYTARQLDEMYKDTKNFVYLIFLEGILKNFSRVNKLFELRDGDVVSLGEDFSLFYQSLLHRIVIPNKLKAVSAKDLFSYDFKADVMHPNCVYFGYAFLKNVDEHGLSVNDIAEVKSRCLEYLVKATEEVQKRVPENVALFQAVSVFSPAKILTVTDLTTTAQRFKNICKDIDATNTEMQLLSKVPVVENLKTDPIKYWNYICNFTDASGSKRFGHISSLALALYSLPYSNAEVERIFSKLNYFKSKLRNKLKSATVSALIHIDCGLTMRKEHCYNFTVTDLMKRKFNASTIYQVSAEDNILGDLAEAAPFTF